jgi:hypothetical protein
MNGYGAAPTRPRGLRPRTSLPPLPDVPLEDALATRDDHLEALDDMERRQDRLDDYEGRPWPSAAVHALPVRDVVERKAAA